LVEEKRTLGLLLGDAGSGKSLLLATLARQLGRFGRQRASVSLIGLGARELLWLLAARLGVEIGPDASQFRLFRALGDHIVANHYQQLSTVFLLDDADEAPSEVRDQLLRLAESAICRGAALTIIISAQAGRLNRLGRRLVEMAELRVDLDGWEDDDTGAFIKGALSAAGRSTPLFTEGALLRIHELSGGVPRRVKQLADLALLAGAGQGLAQIEIDTIESAFRELSVALGEPSLAVVGGAVAVGG
ncbi:MAG TPA: ATP-binding protein, partial [Pirellulales bacterium]|nr:ATP-binding protein [Pirellulales bacterium]